MRAEHVRCSSMFVGVGKRERERESNCLLLEYYTESYSTTKSQLCLYTLTWLLHHVYVAIVTVDLKMWVYLLITTSLL